MLSVVGNFVAAPWPPPVLRVFNEVMFFSQEYGDNKPADFSCRDKLCKPRTNELKTSAAVPLNTSELAAKKKKRALPSALFVYLHGVVGLEFV